MAGKLLKSHLHQGRVFLLLGFRSSKLIPWEILALLEFRLAHCVNARQSVRNTDVIKIFPEKILTPFALILTLTRDGGCVGGRRWCPQYELRADKASAAWGRGLFRSRWPRMLCWGEVAMGLWSGPPSHNRWICKYANNGKGLARGNIRPNIMCLEKKLRLKLLYIF